ncbi:MAG: translocation/assembly module TamB domain-containing protein, partial [Panacagrimonas sp.]
LGPLRIEGLKLEVPGAQIELDRANLVWSPLALLRGEARVAELGAGTLVIRLRERDDEPRDSTPARVPRLPVAVLVERADLARLEIHLPPPGTADPAAPPPEPEIVEQAKVERFEWIGPRFSVARLGARHARVGALEVAARAQLAPATVDVEELTLIERDSQPSATPLRLQARGKVRLDDAPSTLALSWTHLRWPLPGDAQVTSREGHLDVEGTLDNLRARGAFGLGDRGKVQGEGRYAAEQIHADLQWTDLDWPLQGAAPRVHSAVGTIKVEGTPESYRYALDGRLAAEGKEGLARANGSGGLDHVVLDALQLRVARATVDGHARIAWSPQVMADADLRVRDLDPGLIAPAWPGRINGRVQARTQFPEGQPPRVEFDARLADSRLRDWPLALEARGSAIGSSVRLDMLRANSGQTRLEGRGQVTPPFDAQARLDSPDLAALWPGLKGRAALDLRLRGPLELPHVVARGRVEQFEYDDTVSVARLDVDGDVDLAGAWRLDLDVSEVKGPVEVKQARARVNGRASAHTLNLEVDAEPAQVAWELRGAYEPVRHTWSGVLAAGHLQPNGLPRWTLEESAALRLDGARVQLEPACWSAGDSRVCAQVTREPSRLRGAFRLEQLDFAYFASFLPSGWTLGGGVDGTGMVELHDGQLSEARADLSTDPIEVHRDGQLLLQAERGTLLMEEVAGRVVTRVRLPLQGGTVLFDGEIAPGAGDYATRPLQGHLEVKLDDLGFLRVAGEEIRTVSGRIEGTMDWAGTLQQPRPRGELRLDDGALSLATPGIDLTELRARIGTGTGDGTLRIDASAKSGGGTLQVQGTADVVALPPTMNLTIRGEQFQAADMAEARAWISPRLELSLRGDRLDLRGDIEVPRAEITPPSFDSGIGTSSDQVIVTGEESAVEEAGMQVHADVRVILGPKVRFEGFGLKTRLEGSVRAIEEPGRPGSGRGEVRLVEGRYKAYGQDLAISTGRLLFNGGPLTEPAIEIRATRKPREDVEVGVLVRGKLDKPEFSLFSTPAMPRERQLSWLVLGRSIEEGGDADERAMLANAALSLGLSGTDFLAQNLTGGLGLDDISIGAEAGEQADQARFTVGKYLSPKLYVSYGVGIFQPGQVFKLLYELGRGFKFSTESGVHTGGDLLYSIER